MNFPTHAVGDELQAVRSDAVGFVWGFDISDISVHLVSCVGDSNSCLVVISTERFAQARSSLISPMRRYVKLPLAARPSDKVSVVT